MGPLLVTGSGSGFKNFASQYLKSNEMSKSETAAILTSTDKPEVEAILTELEQQVVVEPTPQRQPRSALDGILQAEQASAPLDQHEAAEPSNTEDDKFVVAPAAAAKDEGSDAESAPEDDIPGCCDKTCTVCGLTSTTRKVACCCAMTTAVTTAALVACGVVTCGGYVTGPCLAQCVQGRGATSGCGVGDATHQFFQCCCGAQYPGSCCGPQLCTIDGQCAVPWFLSLFGANC